MNRLLVALAFVFGAASSASATWSVIAVDRRNGTLVIASATCVPQETFPGWGATGLMDIQAIVAPGHGVAAAQANVDRTRRNQRLIFRELLKGTAPADILTLLAHDPGIETRQFAIVDLQGRSAGFSGGRNQAAALDLQGTADGGSIVFSIQGNILASTEVAHAAARAFEAARGNLADRAMAAMEAADQQGGDKRCTCQTPPKPPAPCGAKTAHVAYILRAERDDPPGQSYNDSRHTMYLSVTDQDIEPHENANPVRTLRMRYDAWVKANALTPQAAGAAADRARRPPR